MRPDSPRSPPSSPPTAAVTDTMPSDFAADATRPPSLWPETTRPADLHGASFVATRFDPLADERVLLQTQAAAAFDVCHAALALRAVLLVQAVLAIAALAGANTAAEWGARQAALAFGGAAATLLWLVAVCALKPALRAAQPASRSAAVLGLGMAAALLAAAPLWWAGLAGEPGMPGALRTASVALAGLAFAALLWAWLDLRARLWHPAQASARLAELQSRIRPHFLFNALNTALALVRVDPARAERVLEDLAELFRVALAEVNAAVTLEEEIALARRYLDIEQVRFGARLQVQWHVEPRTRRARIPPLVLQPLVENAVRHGIEPSARGGRVTVRASVLRGQAVVVVSNTLAPDDTFEEAPDRVADKAPGNPGNPGTSGNGMALNNVRERLRLLHDVGAQCDVWREGSGDDAMFHARIVLPLE